MLVSRRATGKLLKHGIAVYPLEAYGFLIGTCAPNVICAALSVGRTSRWYDTSDRFASLGRARALAAEFVASVSLEVVAVYHTVSGGHPDFADFMSDPREQAPVSMRDLLLLVTPTHGGDSIWGHRLYAYDAKGGWIGRQRRPTRLHVEAPDRNARRLGSGWLRVCGPVSYENDHRTELRRLFGLSCPCRKCRAEARPDRP